MPQERTLDLVERIRPDITKEVRRLAKLGHTPGTIAQYLVAAGVYVSDDVVRRWLGLRGLRR